MVQMPMRIHEYLEMVEEGGQNVIRCVKCKYIYCSPKENFLERAICAAYPLPAINQKRPENDKFVSRVFYCPGCGIRIHCEVCQPGDPLIEPIKIYV